MSAATIAVHPSDWRRMPNPAGVCRDRSCREAATWWASIAHKRLVVQVCDQHRGAA